jgi:glucosylceramidase
MLWNLALDEQHGPHTGGCNDCRGVVTIDAATGAVTRNEEYYALAHASRFVRPGARRVASTSGSHEVETVAFHHLDDGSVVLIAATAARVHRPIVVHDRARAFRANLPPRSVTTFVWR